MANRISVPARLTNPQGVVRATRDAAVGVKAGDDGRIRIGPRPGVVHLVVSRPLLRRALLIAQAVCSEAERRGWEVEPYEGSGYGDRPGAAIVVRGHSYAVELHEETETLPFTAADLEKWRGEPAWLTRDRDAPPPQMKRKQAAGRLRLSLPNGHRGGRANWTEGPRGPLEQKLESVFVTLEARAAEDDYRADEAARREQARARAQAERETRERSARIEEARAGRLSAEAEAWQEAVRLREYLRVLRERLPALNPHERVRLSAWCDWAEDRVERADPTVSTARIVGLDDAGDASQSQYRWR